MKNLKDNFKIMLTAIICFFMRSFSNKKDSAKIVKVLANGQAACKNTCVMMGNNAITGNGILTENNTMARNSRMIKNNIFTGIIDKDFVISDILRNRSFFCINGPGDRLRPDLNNTGSG
jgi:hypothetical protein